jgi:hypothetical protein
LKFLFIIFILLTFLFSCGKKEDNDFVDEPVKTSQPETNPGNTQELKEVPNENSKQENPNTQTTLIPEKVISPVEAKSFIGKVVTVLGFVAEVTVREKVTYLNFTEKFPENSFTAVVFANKYDEFGDMTKYKEKNVEVTGIVNTFRNKPQIVLNEKSQIKIKN